MDDGITQAAVKDFISQGRQRFLASEIAAVTGRSLPDTHQTLAAMASRDEIMLALELTHPQTGQHIRTFRLNEPIPLNTTVTCESAPPFIVGEQHFTIAFHPPLTASHG